MPSLTPSVTRSVTSSVPHLTARPAAVTAALIIASRRRVLGAAALALGAGTLLRAGVTPVRAAEVFPNRPIRLIVPFAPGGSSEIVARSVAAEMSKSIGQQVIVENKPGGAGNVAMSEVARAAPDGKTLILGHVGTLAVNPFMFNKLPYDVDKDFVPVTLLARVPNLFVVNAELSAKNFAEFLAMAKARPGSINYGSAGNGSAGHLAFEYLKMVTGIHVVHIPYRGTGPQITDLVAGQTQAASAGTPPLLPHIRSGKLRAIAVGTAQRVPALPEVPTVAELGYKNFETSQWYGLIAPAGTPVAIVQRLAEEAQSALRSSAVTERFANDSAMSVGSTPAAFAEFIKAEQKRWKPVIDRAGIRPD
jgi:tripartite-type tricarboxylate transporter receptor subunit TctC